MFPPGTPVRFNTTHGPRFGTVVEVLRDSIHGDHIHRVQPDGNGDVMLLLGRSLTALDVMPFVVAADCSDCSGG